MSYQDAVRKLEIEIKAIEAKLEIPCLEATERLKLVQRMNQLVELQSTLVRSTPRFLESEINTLLNL